MKLLVTGGTGFVGRRLVESAVAAVFACEPSLRGSWLSLVAAQVKHAGGRRNIAELCQTIERLGSASKAVGELLPAAKLLATGNAELETELIFQPQQQPIGLGCHQEPVN